ncbi:MAG: glycosyltransferase [Patescibacteria group bacterium]|nr:glycosyltransferase [Patescibacteria group bacterium]MDE2057832.1 glycosyltransferase [Patescibacteria group bacterium]
MRLMLVGTDRALFEEGSALEKRFARFAMATDIEVASVVFSLRTRGPLAPRAVAPDVRAYPTNSRLRLLYPLDALRVAKHLPRPDIVSAQDPFETGLAALLIARHFGVPFAVEMHTDFLASAFARHSLLNRVRLALARFVLPRAAGGYAVSARLKDGVVARYRLRGDFAVLPIAVDLARFAGLAHTRRARFAMTLLFVGRLEEEKRPAFALAALAAARAGGADVGLVYVGDGSLRASLEEEARRRGLASVVEFAGRQADVGPYYAMADAVLVTSAYEGYGLVIAEALAAGVPVIATDVGIAREAGAVIAPADEAGYARAVAAWLAGPRAPGVLALRPYASEWEYFERVRAHYARLARLSV